MNDNVHALMHITFLSCAKMMSWLVTSFTYQVSQYTLFVHGIDRKLNETDYVYSLYSGGCYLSTDFHEHEFIVKNLKKIMFV
jgi:hypothetical protein